MGTRLQSEPANLFGQQLFVQLTIKLTISNFVESNMSIYKPETCLSSSKFIAFFDECGDHSLINIDKDFPLFLLCTVVVERETYALKIIPAIAKFKLRYFAHEGINLHSRDIRKAEGPFKMLQNPTVRRSFLGEISALHLF